MPWLMKSRRVASRHHTPRRVRHVTTHHDVCVTGLAWHGMLCIIAPCTMSVICRMNWRRGRCVGGNWPPCSSHSLPQRQRHPAVPGTYARVGDTPTPNPRGLREPVGTSTTPTSATTKTQTRAAIRQHSPLTCLRQESMRCRFGGRTILPTQTVYQSISYTVEEPPAQQSISNSTEANGMCWAHLSSALGRAAA